MSFLFAVVLALMLAVFIVMMLGIFNLARGGEGSAVRSNKLMVWRVGLQGTALAALGLLFYLSKTPS